MKLTVVIPALNEEEGIASIIERTLAAKEKIIAETPLDDLEIIVVSDGSSDATPDIAKKYLPDIKLISYRVNRGYGAAIKLGFQYGAGDLVGFLDADGTCDPNFFAPLVNALFDKKADIALGNRMTDQSEMPPVRRLGNRIFATIIGLIAATRISDSASGMRVIRRESLKRIYPLPDGLHFTPAMSCRAALDENLSMVEVPMPYAERMGQSKLSAFWDGLRFAQVIFEIALSYRPFRIFGTLGLLLMIIMGFFGLEALAEYFQTGHVHDGMVFRVLAILVLGVTGQIAFAVGMLGERVAHLTRTISRPHGPLYRFFRKITEGEKLFWVGTAFVLISVMLTLRPLVQYISTGKIFVHWSQVGFAGFCFLFGAQFVAMAALDRILVTVLQKEGTELSPHHDPEEVFDGGDR